MGKRAFIKGHVVFQNRNKIAITTRTDLFDEKQMVESGRFVTFAQTVYYVQAFRI